MGDTTSFGNRGGDQSPWGRVLVESSLLDRVAAHVDGWTPMPAADASWLTDSPVPDGWQRLEVADDAATPLRVVATTVEGHSGWAGLQTLSAFRFTGELDSDLLMAGADKGLQDWNAEGVRVDPMVLPKLPGVCGVRASGYIAVDNQLLWVRHHTFVRGSAEPDQGLLVEQIDAAAAGPRMRLGPGFGALSESVEGAFVTHIGAAADDMSTAVADHIEQMRREVEGGPVLSGEQKRFLVSALSMWGGVASDHLPPVQILGYASRVDFDADVDRFCGELGLDEPDLSSRDWSRIQFLAEISWASDMFGAGVEFEVVSPFRDAEALALLRSIQRTLIRVTDRALVFPAVGTATA